MRWLRSQTPESCHPTAPSFLGRQRSFRSQLESTFLSAVRVVSSTYAKVKNNHSVTDNWIELFILSQCVLRSTTRGGSKHLRYEENNVQSRLNRWLNGEATQLWFETTSSSLSSLSPSHPEKSMLSALGNLAMKEVTVKPLPRSAQRVCALMTRLYRSCKKNILLLSLPCCLPSLLQILTRAAFPVTY